MTRTKHLNLYLASLCILAFTRPNLGAAIENPGVSIASIPPDAGTLSMPLGQRAVDISIALKTRTFNQVSGVTVFDVPFNEVSVTNGNCNGDLASQFNGWYVHTPFNSNLLYDGSLYNAKDFHPGQDWNGQGQGREDVCQPVYSIGRGLIIAKGNGGALGFGNMLFIVHRVDGQFILSVYAHLKEMPSLPVGSTVDTLTPIARVGTTGNSTGPHLHWEVRRSSFLQIDDTTVRLRESPPFTPTAWPGTARQFISANYCEPSTLVKSYVCVGTPAPSFSAARDFSISSNPNGAWSYGSTSTLGGTFTPYNFPEQNQAGVSGLNVWSFGPQCVEPCNGTLVAPWVVGLPTEAVIPSNVFGVAFSPDYLTLHPDDAGYHPPFRYSVVRWTAPSAGAYITNGFFRGVDLTGTTTDVHVQINNAPTDKNAAVNGFGSQYSFLFTRLFAARETVEFVVGDGGNSETHDSTGFNVQVAQVFTGGTSVPALFGTGLDNTNTLLPDGSTDPHYRLIGSADPAYPGPNVLVAAGASSPIPPFCSGTCWMPNGPNTKWVAPRADAANGNAAGHYTYRTTFDLTGFDPQTAVIVGQWSPDDFGIDIRINGVSTGQSVTGTLTTGAFFSFYPFAITSGFVPGINTLDFVVQNNAGPTGLRVEMSGTARKIP